MNQRINVKKNNEGVSVTITTMAGVRKTLYTGLRADEVISTLLRLSEEKHVAFRPEEYSEYTREPDGGGYRNFFLWNNSKLVMVETDKVAYLEACRCYCEIHMSDGRLYVPSLSLSKVAESLPDDCFIRVHRSFMVNRRMMTEIYGNTICMSDGKQLPIGREFRKSLMQSLVIINTQNKKYAPE
jgi:DNA-binding LytR/AlgR family response regulator